MVKKISLLAVAGLIALPGIAGASAGKTPHDIEQKIDDLAREIDALKAELAKQNEALTEVDSKVSDVESSIGEQEEVETDAIKFSADFRSRIDYLQSDTVRQYSSDQITQAMSFALPSMGFGSAPYSMEQIQMAVNGLKMYSAEQRAALFSSMGISPQPSVEYNNDTNWTNRLRLNMNARVTDYVTFKGRLAMYKVWGMQSNPTSSGPFLLGSYAWDGNATRQPEDSVVRVDRAYVNWTEIGGLPIWLSIGRRPTTDGPPAYLRMGTDKEATPIAYMDYPFDGATLGYFYKWDEEGAVGRVRFCYGRGFEGGISIENIPGSYGPRGLNDMDFAGINWDVYQKADRLLNIQSFGAFNLVNTPDGIDFENPLESHDLVEGDGILDRTNLGNMFHTSFVYMDKVNTLNYFISSGWSHTKPSGYDELGNSLLLSWWDELDEQDGFSFYAGIRYDLDDIGLKLGLEYNWGSQYWMGLDSGHDDLYNGKLSTRGHVGEAYLIYDLPTGEAISRYAKTFVRLGYQYYKYEYTGSGTWLGAPVEVDELASDPLYAQFYPALDDINHVYLTFEAYF